MKILQLGKFYPIKGGVEKVMFDLSAAILKKGITVEILCAGEKRKNFEFIYDNIPVHATGTILSIFSTMLSPLMVLKLKKISGTFDIIHIHHPDPMAALSLYLSNYKGKIILHWHSDIIKQKKLLFFYSPLQNWLLRRTNIIIATSPLYAEHSTILQSFKNKIKIVPIGINNVDIPMHNGQIKQSYNGKKIIFSLGRLIYYKGFEFLINAAKYLGDEYVILIGGSGPLEKDLRHLIEKENLSTKVFLLGRIPQEELGHYYADCDIFCLSSVEKSEAFGIVQIEAMAYSKPVIATNIEESGVPWVNKHGTSGLNVTPKNPQELATAIKNICENRALYEKLSKGAKSRFDQLFTIDKMSESIIEIYNEII